MGIFNHFHACSSSLSFFSHILIVCLCTSIFPLCANNSYVVSPERLCTAVVLIHGKEEGCCKG